MIPGAVHRSPGIYSMAVENPVKLQLGDCLMKALQQFIASNGVPYLQMTTVGLHSISGRENKGKYEWDISEFIQNTEVL